MSTKVKLVLLLEMVVVLILLVALVRRGFLWTLFILVILAVLAHRTRSRVFKVLSMIALLVNIIMVISSGWFWLILVIPLITGIILYNQNLQTFSRQDWNEKEPGGRSQSGPRIWQKPDPSDGVNRRTQGNDHDIIDLAQMEFHLGGNDLQIKKNQGNTKIIVPEGVEIALSAQVVNGVVKVFNRAAEVNAVNLKYFSEGYESADRRVNITIQVVTGNVEVVRG